MEGKHSSLLNQLSGLRLSDGNVVGARVASGNTPPTLSAYSSRSTPTASPTSFPAASLSSGATTSAQAGPTPPPPATRRGARGAKKEAEAAAPSSSVTDKINRLLAQNKGSLANSAAAAAPVPSSTAPNDKGASILSSLAAQVGRTPSPSSSGGAASSPASSTPPTAGKSAAVAAAPPAVARTATAPSTSTKASAVPAAASTAAAPRTAVAVPKPRSVEAATVAPKTSAVVVPAEQLAPTVMDFFNKAAVASRSPPPLAEQTAVLKSAVIIAEAPINGKPAAIVSSSTTTTTDTATIATNTTNTTTSGSRKEKERTPAQVSTPTPGGSSARGAPAAKAPKDPLDPANKFLVDAFGSVDNLDVTKPIIRTAPNISSTGRYIIVGDLHGCVDQLEQLVEKVKYVKGTDCLLIIGDYVNKGPDSIGVVRACQRLGAYGVLGNHDYTLLRCCARMRRRPFTPEDLRDPVKRLAQKFPKDCEYYLRGLPHMIRIPRHNVLLVHAGLNLQHTLENQNVEEVMHLRRLEAVAKKPGTYRAISKGMEGEPWAKLWSGPEMVVFGHDAYAGFQSHPHACGIDTGCVYGDPLTCVVFGVDSPAGDFFSVSGLPKLENEMKGLPPPNSDIYEQDDVDLAKLIIRPTSRATPALLGGGLNGRPVFLAAPLGYTGADGDEASSGSPSPSGITAANANGAATTTALGVKASALTATVTSTNMHVSPSSLSPPRLVTPACTVNARFMETTTANTREVQRATLLALSATRELSAIAVLLAMPLYAQEIDAMLEAEGRDKVTQEAFWVPFARLVLVAAAEMTKSGTPAPSLAVLEPAVQLALDVCEEMDAVCTTLQVELKALLAAERESPAWPKRVVKCAATLVA